MAAGLGLGDSPKVKPKSGQPTDVEELAVVLDHQVLQVPVADAQQVRDHAEGRAGLQVVVEDLLRNVPQVLVRLHELEPRNALLGWSPGRRLALGLW